MDIAGRMLFSSSHVVRGIYNLGIGYFYEDRPSLQVSILVKVFAAWGMFSIFRDRMIGVGKILDTNSLVNHRVSNT